MAHARDVHFTDFTEFMIYSCSTFGFTNGLLENNTLCFIRTRCGELSFFLVSESQCLPLYLIVLP